MHEPDTVFATAFYKKSWLGISGTRGFVYTLHRYMDPSGFKTQRSKAQECAFAVNPRPMWHIPQLRISLVFTGLLSDQGEKSIHFYFIMVSLKDKKY